MSIFQSRAQQRAALNAKLKAEVDRLDTLWANSCDRDVALVLDEIKKGKVNAQLLNWGVQVSARSPAERETLVDGLMPIVDFRNMRRKKARLEAESQVEWARRRKQAEIEEAVEQQRRAEEQKEDERKYAIECARKARLNGAIDLSQDAGIAGITFGTSVRGGADLIIPVDRIQHTLVGGMPGSGKTVFLHSLIVQLLRSSQVDQLVLIDLKGGTEFACYDDEPKARVYGDMEGVVAALDSVIELLEARQVEMLARKLRTYPGSRVFIVIDEYAMINAYLASARVAGQKASAVQLANSLRQIVLTARSLGVVLICALQKPTSDAIDSNIKANMGFRCCFALKTRQAVEAVLDYTEELPGDPRRLGPGRFLFDSGRGELTLVQAHVPPGLDLSGGW